jgi:hypothetical protein
MMTDRDPVAWAAMTYELEDAAGHLAALLRRMAEDGDYGEPELRVDLGHVYAHLNRAWNSRHAQGDTARTPEAHAAWSRFPTDLDPVG